MTAVPNLLVSWWHLTALTQFTDQLLVTPRLARALPAGLVLYSAIRKGVESPWKSSLCSGIYPMRKFTFLQLAVERHLKPLAWTSWFLVMFQPPVVALKDRDSTAPAETKCELFNLPVWFNFKLFRYCLLLYCQLEMLKWVCWVLELGQLFIRDLWFYWNLTAVFPCTLYTFCPEGH